VSVDPENQLLSITKNWPTAPNVFFEHAQGVGIYRQHPLPTAFQLLNLSLLDLDPALGAERMAPAKSLSAPGAQQLQASLEVFYGYSALSKVYVLNLQS
jgi:hypothetical protein